MKIYVSLIIPGIFWGWNKHSSLLKDITQYNLTTMKLTQESSLSFLYYIFPDDVPAICIADNL